MENKPLPSTLEETGPRNEHPEKCPACICYEHLLHLIQLAVCDPREATKGNMPSKAKAVEMIIDRAIRVPPSPSPEYFASGYTRKDLEAMHPDIKLEPEWKKCPQCGRENSITTWQKFDGKCPNCGDLHDRDAGAAPSSVTPPQDELEHMKSQRDYLQRVCSKIQMIVGQSDLPDRSSELDVLPSSVAILAARASSPSSATEPQNWIRVTHDSPKERGFYLVWPGRKMGHAEVMYRNLDGDWVGPDAIYNGQTHWQNLPGNPNASSAGTPEGK